MKGSFCGSCFSPLKPKEKRVCPFPLKKGALCKAAEVPQLVLTCEHYAPSTGKTCRRCTRDRCAPCDLCAWCSAPKKKAAPKKKQARA